MDVSSARTFLAIADTGSFAAAAARLNITQSAVSIRVKKLEEVLGQPLFDRGRFGALPTAAGRRFQASAAAIVRAWEVARATVGAAKDTKRRLILGAQHSIAEVLVDNWLPVAMGKFPDLSFRIEAGGRRTLERDLREGLLDLAVLFHAESGQGVRVARLAYSTLVAVRTPTPEPAHEIGVSWMAVEEANIDQRPLVNDPPRVSFSLGTLARRHLLNTGGNALLPDFIVRTDLREGRLLQVDGAQPIENPVDIALRTDLVLEGQEALIKSLVAAFA